MKYGWTEEKAKEGPVELAKSVKLFCDQLESQKAKGSEFIIGNSLSILDVYFATMSYFLKTPTEDIMPKTRENRRMMDIWNNNEKEVWEVLEKCPYLVEWRDNIVKTYFVTPANIGGRPVPPSS